jgi:hypothetical protein
LLPHPLVGLLTEALDFLEFSSTCSVNPECRIAVVRMMMTERYSPHIPIPALRSEILNVLTYQFKTPYDEIIVSEL